MIMIMISYNVLQKRLICQKYSPEKYAMLLYVAVSIRWIDSFFLTVLSWIYSREKSKTGFFI